MHEPAASAARGAASRQHTCWRAAPAGMRALGLTAPRPPARGRACSRVAATSSSQRRTSSGWAACRSAATSPAAASPPSSASRRQPSSAGSWATASAARCGARPSLTMRNRRAPWRSSSARQPPPQRAASSADGRATRASRADSSVRCTPACQQAASASIWPAVRTPGPASHRSLRAARWPPSWHRHLRVGNVWVGAGGVCRAADGGHRAVYR